MFLILCSLSVSRNQLSVLPAVVCSLPLKVLIACNNKLVSLPEELGQLRHLTELVCLMVILIYPRTQINTVGIFIRM